MELSHVCSPFYGVSRVEFASEGEVWWLWIASMRYGTSVPDVFDQHVAIKLAGIVSIKVVLERFVEKRPPPSTIMLLAKL